MKQNDILPNEVLINRKQLSVEVSERNEYRNLLEMCITVFNFLPNRKTHLTSENSTIYKLIST